MQQDQLCQPGIVMLAADNGLTQLRFPVGVRAGVVVWHACLVDLAEIEVWDTVGIDRLAQVMDLFASAWWTASRTTGDVARMLAASSLAVALVHRPVDRLVGFARVVSDEVYLAVVLDVIVAHEWRGQRLGAMLLDAVVGHPRLAGVRSIELVCQPELVTFTSAGVSRRMSAVRY